MTSARPTAGSSSSGIDDRSIAERIRASRGGGSPHCVSGRAPVVTRSLARTIDNATAVPTRTIECSGFPESSSNVAASSRQTTIGSRMPAENAPPAPAASAARARVAIASRSLSPMSGPILPSAVRLRPDSSSREPTPRLPRFAPPVRGMPPRRGGGTMSGPARSRTEGSTSMDLGYDSPLYILAFDHRGSFQKKFFGIQGEPTPEETATISDAKHLIFEGALKAVENGANPDVTGVLVDEQFGGDIPPQAKDRGLKLAMPVEKSGQNEFDFQYGDDFGAHIEKFDPDFTKVLVRYNPDGDAEMNARQTARLKRLSDWLHERDRKF